MIGCSLVIQRCCIHNLALAIVHRIFSHSCLLIQNLMHLDDTIDLET